jgi:hypothetical protein
MANAAKRKARSAKGTKWASKPWQKWSYSSLLADIFQYTNLILLLQYFVHRKCGTIILISLCNSYKSCKALWRHKVNVEIMTSGEHRYWQTPALLHIFSSIQIWFCFYSV